MQPTHQRDEALAKARAKAQEMRDKGIKPQRKTPIERLADNPTSLRNAINAKCWDCENGDADPHVSRRIGTCPITTCPLWNVRPHQHYAKTIQHPELLHNLPKVEIDEDDA